MFTLSIPSGHWYWNHWVPNKAPQPHWPEASDRRVRSGLSLLTSQKRETLFHPAKNLCHHSRSERKAQFKRQWWSSPFSVEAKVIIRLRNTLPGFTTVLACWSWPIRDSSSRFEHLFLPLHTAIVSCSRLSFSAGRRNSCFTVSISMPKKVRMVAGPSHLARANGTPNSLKICNMTWKLRSHSSESGAPDVKKSSK